LAEYREYMQYWSSRDRPDLNWLAFHFSWIGQNNFPILFYNNINYIYFFEWSDSVFGEISLLKLLMYFVQDMKSASDNMSLTRLLSILMCYFSPKLSRLLNRYFHALYTCFCVCICAVMPEWSKIWIQATPKAMALSLSSINGYVS
jgi:hypothetical protein